MVILDKSKKTFVRLITQHLKLSYATLNVAISRPILPHMATFKGNEGK